MTSLVYTCTGALAWIAGMMLAGLGVDVCCEVLVRHEGALPSEDAKILHGSTVGRLLQTGCRV